MLDPLPCHFFTFFFKDVQASVLRQRGTAPFTQTDSVRQQLSRQSQALYRRVCACWRWGADKQGNCHISTTACSSLTRPCASCVTERKRWREGRRQIFHLVNCLDHRQGCGRGLVCWFVRKTVRDGRKWEIRVWQCVYVRVNLRQRQRDREGESW